MAHPNAVHLPSYKTNRSGFLAALTERFVNVVIDACLSLLQWTLLKQFSSEPSLKQANPPVMTEVDIERIGELSNSPS